jgi:hypothetical protein
MFFSLIILSHGHPKQNQIMETKSLLALAFCIFLSSCGGGGLTESIIQNKYSTTPPALPASAVSEAVATVVEIINGIPVPPDPGAAKDATLAGVDSDHNGIRDEIDRWIATKYGDKPGALEAIRMVARVTQKLMVANPLNEAEAKVLVDESIDVGWCADKKLRSEVHASGNVLNDLMTKQFAQAPRFSHGVSEGDLHDGVRCGNI